MPTVPQVAKVASVRGVPLACPSCHGPLDDHGNAVRCDGCRIDYAVVDGRPRFVDSQGTWSAPTPVSGGWLRRHLARPPHAARFAGELSNSGVTNDHRSLRAFLEAVPVGGHLLDLGSGDRRLTAGVVNVDVVAAPSVDVVADGGRLPFPDAVFDGVVLQSVIEHVLEPEALLAESRRVMRPGARIWIEAPFLYPVHDSADYYRWTLAGLRHVVSKHFEVIDSGTVMGPSAALSLGWRAYANWKLRSAHWAFRNSLAWLTAWVKRLDADKVLVDPPEIYAQIYVVGASVVGRS